MSRGRRRGIKALVVLGSVLAFLSVFAIWVERQAFDTDEWVQTSDRLIQNETIRKTVAEFLVDQLYEHVDVEKEVEGFLPGGTKDFAGPVAGGLRQVAGNGADQVLRTSTAQELWRLANRTAHEELVAVLEDRQREGVSTAEGEVRLDLATLVTNLADEVGIGQRLAERLPEDAGEVTILRSDELRTAQDVAAGIKGLALLLSLLTLAAFGAAIWLSREERWVTMLFCGVGLAAAGFADIVLRSAAGGIVLDELVKEESIRPAAEQAWRISTSLMVDIATTVIVLGVLAGLAGWLASPNRAARATRRAVAPILRERPGYVYAALAIVVSIFLLSAPTQNLRSFLTILIVGGLVAFGIHELRKQTLREFPDVKLDDVFGRTRERVTDAVRSAEIGERVSEGVSRLRLPEVRRPRRERGERGAGETAAGVGAGAGRGAGTAAGAPAGGAVPRADGAPAADRIDLLERLGELKAKGVLTEEEFAAEKSRLLGGGPEGSSGA